MTALQALLSAGRLVAAHQPWPRSEVEVQTWVSAAQVCASGRLALLGLWGEKDRVHMALLEESAVAVLSLSCPQGQFPSVGQYHPPAIRLERALRDLYGLVPEGAPDLRPWLDHGRSGTNAEPYAFLAVDGEDLHQIAVGPVHAGIIEPGHFRFTASGETVVRLEERLGYVHKGIESLMAGATLDRAASLACHTSGDSAVAYAFAFARAAEAASAQSPPPRAVFLRAVMAEMERVANHLGDLGAICNDASFSLMHAHSGILREHMLRAANAAFGHRLMMDCIAPGGLTADIKEGGIDAITAAVHEIRGRFPALIEIYDATASLQDRTVGTGHLKPEMARQFAAGGYIGRASGRGFDTRRTLSYAPYDAIPFEVPMISRGDVDARVWIRLREIEQSLSLIDRLLSQLPDGPFRNEIRPQAGEGLALIEGFRGDVLVWLRLNEDGTIAHCHLRDPSWFQWPLLEAVIEGNIVADFPICNKSFNCSYSGHDS